MRVMLIIATTVAAALLVGCDGEPLAQRTESGVARLERISSANAWVEYFRDQITSRMERDNRILVDEDLGFIQLESSDGALAAPAAPPSADTATSGGAAGNGERAAGPEFTGTNVQVSGVDESDVVKTDGDYFYVMVDGEVRIVKAGGLVEVATVDLDVESYGGGELYVFGDRMVVVNMEHGFFAEPFPGGPIPVDVVVSEPRIAAVFAPYEFSDTTIVTIVDISNRLEPVIETRWEFDGRSVSSRMIDGALHLILNEFPMVPYDLDPETLTAEEIEDYIPSYTMVRNGDSSTGLLVSWRDFYRPVDPDGYGITTIVSLDANQVSENFSSIGIMADPGVIYASTTALYISDPDYDFSYKYRERLDIHKFRFDKNGTEYAGSGSVDGRLVNQFALGEHNGYLRVATTTGEPWAWDERTSRNHLFVLGEADGALDVVGSINDLAPGERIYSARFMGDKGFLVTFRQVDPLFTLDLASPEDPLVAGELKIPGFSEYIHIMDEDHLLTLGRAADLEGQRLGLQVSIFDVSTFDDPQLVVSKQIGASSTSSEAEYNHKAFTFDPQQGVLAIPVTLYEQHRADQPWGEFSFAGLQLYDISAEPDGITLRGQISTTPEGFDFPVYYGWTRGIFVDDMVYAITEYNIQQAALAEPGTVLGSLELSELTEFVDDVIIFDGVAGGGEIAEDDAPAEDR